jgi:hypothetical protein
MALYGKYRDISLFNTLNKELIVDIIDIEVSIFKLSLEKTTTNIYEEADNKIYYAGVKIPCLVNRSAQQYNFDNPTIDFSQPIEFQFLRDILVEISLVIEVGDLVEYNGEYYEIDNVIDNQYILGKNPDYASTGTEWGSNFSIIAQGHITRRSKLNIEQVRAGINKENNLPHNF